MQSVATVVVCEPLCIGAEHAPFNSALVEIVRRAYPDAKLHIVADESHFARLGLKSADRLTLHSKKLLPRNQFGLRRILADVQLLRFCLKLAGPNGVVVLASAISSMLLAAKLRNPQTTARIQAVLHGYLNEAVGWRSRNPFRRAFDLRSALCWRHWAVQYIVLERAIEDGLKKAVPLISSNVTLLPHPIPQDALVTPRPLSLPLKIGFLGLATAAKGYTEFLWIAEEVKRRCKDRVEFHVVGRLPDGAPSQSNDALSSLPGDRMPRDEYSTRVADLHYVCLPFSSQHYALAASGVMLDAVAFQKPLLALRAPIVAGFLQDYPEAGQIFESAHDIAQWIMEQCEHPDTAFYGRAVQSMAIAARSRQPDMLAAIYRESVIALQ